MPRTHRRRSLNVEEVKLDMTPMIDMVFLLLTFFMFTAKLTDLLKDHAVDLPLATSAKPDNRPPGTIIINIHKDNEGLYVDNQHYTPEQMVAFLTQRRKDFPGQEVVIRGDGRAFHKNLVRVMECCARSGLMNVKVAATTERMDLSQ